MSYDHNSMIGTAEGASLHMVDVTDATQQLMHNAFDWVRSTVSSITGAVNETMRDGETQPTQSYPETNAIDPPSTPSSMSSVSYALTPTLIEFVNALSEQEATFIHFPKANQPFLMTEIQVTHARRILESSPAFARMRFRLVPSRMKEEQLWRVYFILMKNVVMKARRGHAMGEGEQQDGAVSEASSQHTSPTAAASSSVAPIPSSPAATARRAIALDYNEIDRLCGINTAATSAHPTTTTGSSISTHSLINDDEESRIDGETDEVISEIVRRHHHRVSNSSFPFLTSPAKSTSSPAAAASAQHHERHPSSSDGTSMDALNTSIPMPSEEDLDAALAAETATTHQQHHASSDSLTSAVKLDASTELP